MSILLDLWKLLLPSLIGLNLNKCQPFIMDLFNNVLQYVKSVSLPPPPVSECQLCGWWSWVGNSVERWGGQVGELSIPLLLLLLGAWRFIFTRQRCTSWNTWAAAILWRSYVWRLPRNAVSELPVGHILKQENNLLCSISLLISCDDWCSDVLMR